VEKDAEVVGGGAGVSVRRCCDEQLSAQKKSDQYRLSFARSHETLTREFCAASASVGRIFLNAVSSLPKPPLMTRELILYCDESDISGKHFANFYGGALVESMHLNEVIETLLASKKQLHLGAEIKWQKISENYAGKYIELMDTTFSLVAAGKLKLRIMFTQNYFGVSQLSAAQRENGFFLLYYQFVKHAFGLQFCTQQLGPARLRIYFDKLPDTDAKCLAFKAVVSGLSQSPAFERARVTIAREQIAEVDSKNHVILQCLDVVLGSMQFRLNEKHKTLPEGAQSKGRRTLAKERVYRHINGRIRQLHPNFNVGVSTGGHEELRWHQPYRHWLFKPLDLKIRPEFAKRK